MKPLRRLSLSDLFAADGNMAESECAPVVVEGDWSPAQTKNLKNKLQLYFGSKKRSSGGDCRVETEDGALTAVVFFSSEEGENRKFETSGREFG